MISKNLDQIVKQNEEYITINDYYGVLTEIPEDKIGLPRSIKSLNVRAKNITSLPNILKEFTINEKIEFGTSKIKKIPDFILRQPIKSLHISSPQLRIGSELESFKELEVLELRDFYGRKWPIDLKKFSKLKKLAISEKIGKKISHKEIIIEVAEAKMLDYLSLNFNLDIDSIGESIRLLNHIPLLDFYLYDSSRDISNFAFLTRSKLNNNYAEKNLQVFDYQQIVKGENFSDHELKLIYCLHKGRIDLINRLIKIQLSTVHEQNAIKSVFFSFRPKNQLLKDLREALPNIEVGYSVDIGNSLIVIGSNTSTSDLISYIKTQRSLCTEDHLKELITEVTSPWLRENSNAESNIQLYQLLVSNQPENIELAFQIIDGGGATEEIQSMLAVLMTTHPNKKISTAAEKLFKKFGPTSTYDFIKGSKISFKRSGSTWRKLNAMFKEDIKINSTIFRIYHGLIAGENRVIKDVNPQLLSFKDHTFSYPIPNLIQYFDRIVEINLEGTKNLDLKTSLSSLSKLESLRKLNLSKCKLNIPSEIGTVVQLEQLNLSGNSLAAEDSLRTLSKLRTLELEACNVQNWGFIKEMPLLTDINASRNKLNMIPQSIIESKSVRNYNLSYNKMTAIPKALLDKYIINLNVRNNQIEELDYKIFDIMGLTDLNLSGNKIENFDAGKVPNNRYRNIEILSLASNKLATFSIKEGSFPMLKKLDISNNNISILDGAVFRNTKLIDLLASRNAIETIPEEITIRYMNKVDLSQNRIKRLEAFFDKVRAHSLDLKKNEISYMAPEIKDKGDLSRMYWSFLYNPISRIPR